MKKLLLPLLLLALPAHANSLQFDSQPAPATNAAAPGMAWLQQQPMTLFDLGMMELSETATKATEGLFDVAGAVAEYREESGRIAVTFYARTPYSEQNCQYIATKMREQMFPKRDDRRQLALELAAYFVSYGPAHPGRPSGIGEELVDRLSIAVFLPGGACEVPLTSDDLTFWKDPNFVATAPATQLPPDAAPATPAPAPATPAPHHDQPAPPRR